MRKIVAAFDFDGTLTEKDSLLPFFIATFGRFTTIKALIYLSLPLFLTLFSNDRRKKAKEILLTYFLKGKSLEFGKSAGVSFAENLLKEIKPRGKEKFNWHKKQGHITVLVSANLTLFLEPFGKGFGFDHVLATIPEVDKNELFTGLILGENCRNGEKVKRLEAFLGPLSSYEIYAYGDSDGDKELLAIADHPHYRVF